MSATTCHCPAATTPPWRERDTPVSTASFLCGVLLAALGVVLVATAPTDVAVPAGVVLLGLWAATTITSGVHAAVTGHRRPGCLVLRSLWLGLAWLGLPLRVVLSFPF